MQQEHSPNSFSRRWLSSRRSRVPGREAAPGQMSYHRARCRGRRRQWPWRRLGLRRQRLFRLVFCGQAGPVKRRGRSMTTDHHSKPIGCCVTCPINNPFPERLTGDLSRRPIGHKSHFFLQKRKKCSFATLQLERRFNQLKKLEICPIATPGNIFLWHGQRSINNFLISAVKYFIQRCGPGSAKCQGEGRVRSQTSSGLRCPVSARVVSLPVAESVAVPLASLP